MSDGLCSTAGMKPVLFGENSTSGCLLPVSRQNLTQCSLLRSVALHDYISNVYMQIYVLFNIISFLFRETVTNLQADLIAATYVAKSGNPDFLTMADWINISCKYGAKKEFSFFLNCLLFNNIKFIFAILVLPKYFLWF